MKKFILCALSPLVLAGCASWSSSTVDGQQYIPTAAQIAERKDPQKIILSDQDVLDRQYVSLGDISVTVNKTTIFNADPTPEMVNEKLRERGADLGADAIILVRYGKTGMSMMSWGSLEGKGRAIKFSK